MSEVFSILNAINVNGHTEEKNRLTYLSWSWAWAELKKVYSDATYQIRHFDGKPYLYDENLGYMVMTEITIEGITHEMWLPVMDGANKARKNKPYDYYVKNPNFKYAKLNEKDGKYYDKYGNEQTEYTEKTVEAATMFDINTAIMRCLTKNIAMFGLGLYIYAGEDLPEDETERKEEEKKQAETEPKKVETEPKKVENDPKDIGKLKITPDKVDALAGKAVADGVPLGRICSLYKVPDIESMNNKQYKNCMDNWEKIKEME